MLTRSYHIMSKAPHSCRLRIFHVFKINSNKKIFYDSSTFLFFVFRFAQHAQHLEIYVFLAVDSSTHGPGRWEIVFRAKPGGNWETSRFSLRFSLTHSRSSCLYGMSSSLKNKKHEIQSFPVYGAARESSHSVPAALLIDWDLFLDKREKSQLIINNMEIWNLFRNFIALFLSSLLTSRRHRQM